MRITKIAVKGLFGYLDHEIPLNQDSRITIIHGPNGVGKTVLMRMVHGLFHYEYEYLGSIPFEELRIGFSNGAILTVEKGGEEHDKDAPSTLRIHCVNENREICSPFTLVVADENIQYETIEAMFPEFTPVYMLDGRLLWAAHVDKRRDKAKREDLIEDLYDILLPPRIYTKADLLDKPKLRTELYGEIPEWFMGIKNSVELEFISVTRLRQEIGRNRSSQDWLPRWAKAERDIIKISKIHFETPPEDSSTVFLPGQHAAIEEVEAFFRSLRADLDNRQMIKWEIEELEKAQAERSILAITFKKEIEDKIEEMRDELDGLAPGNYYAAEELSELLNKHLLFKALQCDDDDMTVTLLSTPDRAEIPFSALSSGEQQLLVMYYHLFVKTESDTLVMIDEPEISMNVAWQRNFLKDLQRIVELRKFDVLIATHSPQIIHDKWDWMVALGETVDSEEADD